MVSDVLHIMFGQGGRSGLRLPARAWQVGMDGCHQLVFAANGSCVDTTIIDGRIVFEDRQFTTVDEQKILREANAAFRRVVDRMVVSPA